MTFTEAPSLLTINIDSSDPLLFGSHQFIIDAEYNNGETKQATIPLNMLAMFNSPPYYMSGIKDITVYT